MEYLWLAVPFLVAIVAWIGYKVTTPAFVTGLIRQIIFDLVRAATPLFKNKPKTPEEWKAQRELQQERMNRRN